MKLKRFAVITMARNETIFLPKWIAYYGGIFGFENLYVVLDGYDQTRPNCAEVERVNFLTIPQKPEKTAQADRTRATFVSHLSTSLFHYYDSVIFTDTDEFLVVDPKTNTDLVSYLSAVKARVSIAALGIDVVHDHENEPALDPTRPYLEQRHFGQLDSAYSKPSTLFRPARRGGGGHRLKYHFSRIDPNLYLFHFGLVDYEQSSHACAGNISQDYQETRRAQFDKLAQVPVQDGDTTIVKARHYQMWKRDIKRPLNPGKMAEFPRISIPKRFRPLV